MKLLEQFYILFTSNSDELKKGSEEATQSTNKTEEALKKTDGAAGKVGDGFVKMAQKGIAALAGLVAVGNVVQSALEAAAYAEDLRLVSDALDENIQEVDAWGRAVYRFGGNSQTMQATLTALNTSIRETAFTGEGALTPVLNRLGIQLRDLEGNIKKPLQLLPELADAFAGLDRGESTYLGEQLGLDPATIVLLQQGRGEVERILAAQRELGLVTREDAEASREFNLQLARTSDVFLTIRQQVATRLLPAMTWFVERLEGVGRFVQRNGPLIEGFFLGLSAVVTAYYLPAMLRAAAATLAATWPLLAIVGIIAAVGLAFAALYDEVVNFARGNDSLLGEAVKRWPILGYVIIGVANHLRQLLVIGRVVFGFLADLIRDPERAVTELFESIDGGMRGLLRMVPIVGSAMSQLYAYLVDTFGGIGNIISGVIDAVSWLESKLNPARTLGRLADWVNSPLSDAESGNRQLLERAQSALNFADTNPFSAQTNNSIITNQWRTSRPVSVNVESVTVETQATDAQGIGSSLSGSLVDQLQRAIFSLDDGVDA